MHSSEAISPDPVESLTKLWADFFEQSDAQARRVLECFGWIYDPRTVRRLWLEAWSQAVDLYFRSPAFLESMRAGLELLTDIKAFQNQLTREFAGQAGIPMASDIHELSDRLRHTEDRLLTQLKAIENRLAKIQTAHDASQPVLNPIDS